MGVLLYLLVVGLAILVTLAEDRYYKRHKK